MIKYLFVLLTMLGNRMLDWNSAGKVEEDAALLSARARRLLKEKTADEATQQPRRLCLLLPLSTSALAFAVDSLALLFRVLEDEDKLDGVESWPVLASLTCYATALFTCLISSDTENAASMTLKIFAGVSVVFHTSTLVVLSVILATCKIDSSLE